ncbi:hypothetical protein ACFLW8_03385 [Chloroflexota bacterium]
MKKNEVLTIRIPAEDLEALDDLAQQKGVSRATMARTILANSRRLYNYLETLRGRNDDIRIAEDIARQMQAKLDEEITPDIADTVSGIMLDAITRVTEQISEKRTTKIE